MLDQLNLKFKHLNLFNNIVNFLDKIIHLLILITFKIIVQTKYNCKELDQEWIHFKVNLLMNNQEFQWIIWFQHYKWDNCLNENIYNNEIFNYIDNCYIINCRSNIR